MQHVRILTPVGCNYQHPDFFAVMCRNSRFGRTYPLTLVRRFSEFSADEFKKIYKIPKTNLFSFSQYIQDSIWKKGRIHAVGYLKNIFILKKDLVFAHMIGPTGVDGNKLQLITRQPQIIQQLQDIALHSPISIVGSCRTKKPPKEINKSQLAVESNCPPEFTSIHRLEVDLEDLMCLNSFPDDLRIGKAQVFTPESRYLQIRHNSGLKERLMFRSTIAKAVRNILDNFHEIETPILFKSTPEGAREFIVPSRKPGYAYALPQSPQQYKQILMASGIDKYYQFARCFRDEDLRADRQPEFTQIDLEVSFADGEQIMNLVESLIKKIYIQFADQISSKLVPQDNANKAVSFPRISYQEAMSRYGSDKPDLRIPGSIIQVDKIICQDLSKMLTDITVPIIEVCKLRLNTSPRKAWEFVKRFMDSSDSNIFRLNPDGAPGFAVYDFTKPISGLEIFGFEGVAELEKMFQLQDQYNFSQDESYFIDREFKQGDLFLVQARKNLPHSGGSTMLGKLRAALYRAAIEECLIERDLGHYYLWVTDFPLFTLDNDDSTGQGGKSGFHSTHHPFTAPKTIEDVDLLLHDPLKAIADHYDLVVNGIELGGGSRRIHVAEMQKFVMKNVLQLSDKRMNDFQHLFDALAAGCPPHAGMALGFDRLIAILTNQDSVKDVIAFPKSSKGDDLMVKSPSPISDTELERYHLKLKSSI
ncbi:Aspartate--tRNA ligase, mitochondrial [Erysiphe neolycopersici]|uniref:Aspartate--tRNA ligase, mitochondrial n=1 Tax=Erysiphe neolycopersici TaxID=212602 RepID=A0A420I3W7_9PEZI|nr:Aspartate--tRNA ligase, mitochondrial [Erysiphe neolycopersici]